MSDKHLSTQYDAELSAISNQVLQMGGLAESQVARAVEALTQLKPDLAEDVLIQEARVNQMEMDIDSELSAIIARRQPTARDLRLLVAIAKMIANLERVGDEAARCSDYTAYMYLGDLVEFGPTREVFTKPKKKDTEDYITGRFG